MRLKNMLIWALRCGQTKAVLKQLSDTTTRLEKFNAVWADAVANVPFYAEWKAKHGLPDRIANLKELATWPILEKRDLILNREKLVRRDVTRFHESVTGGATGEPLHFRTMAGESAAVTANKWIGWARMGIYPDSRMFLLWGHRHFYGQGWKSNLKFKVRQFKDWMTNHKRADATDLSPAALRRDYAMMRTFNPECIVAYSASLLALVRTLRQLQNPVLPPSSAADADMRMPRYSASRRDGGGTERLKAIICTAGPLTKDERAEIEAFFGVPVAMEYGSMEAGVMAYQTPMTGGRYRVFDQTTILHAASDGDAQRRQIVVTTLTKRYLPLIRYRIGDYMDAEALDADGSVATFGEVSGRTGDMVDLGDGVRFHGYSLMVCAEENPKIVAYQLKIEKANKRVVFVAQTLVSLTAAEKEKVCTHAAAVAKVPASTFQVEEATELVKAPSGKIRLVIS